jgi:hypothetical protein
MPFDGTTEPFAGIRGLVYLDSLSRENTSAGLADDRLVIYDQ